MAKIGDLVTLPILTEAPIGAFLDGGELGEILLPRNERLTDSSDKATVFIHNDSEDRPIATEKTPKVLPGQFGALTVLASSRLGAFLDWGLAKDLLLPFSEQRSLPKVGQPVVVHVYLDTKTDRLVASQRISKYFPTDYPPYSAGDEVNVLLFGKTEMGYKAIVDGKYSGLLFANQVFQELFYADKVKAYVSEVRRDGKIDLSLYAPGLGKIDDLESHLEKELASRGGFWDLSDRSPADQINRELGVSKKMFKKALGSLYKQRKITFENDGIRWVDSK